MQLKYGKHAPIAYLLCRDRLMIKAVSRQKCGTSHC